MANPFGNKLPPKEIPCYVQNCLKTFQTEQDLNFHIDTGNHCECDVCSQWFMDWETLMKHKIQADDKEHLCCPLCGLGFGAPRSIERHIRQSHQHSQDITCVGCSNRFRHAGSLMAHLENGHCKGITKHDVQDHLAHKAIIDRVLKIPTTGISTSFEGSHCSSAGPTTAKHRRGPGESDGGVLLDADAHVQVSGEGSTSGPAREQILAASPAVHEGETLITEDKDLGTNSKPQTWANVEADDSGLEASKYAYKVQSPANMSFQSCTTSNDGTRTNVDDPKFQTPQNVKTSSKSTVTDQATQVGTAKGTSSVQSTGVAAWNEFAAVESSSNQAMPQEETISPESFPQTKTPTANPGQSRLGPDSNGNGKVTTLNNEILPNRHSSLEDISNTDGDNWNKHPQVFAAGLAQLDENYKRAKRGEIGPFAPANREPTANPSPLNTTPFDASTKFWDPTHKNFNIELFRNARISLYECPFAECTYKTPNGFFLKAHLGSREEHGGRQHQCPKCRKLFGTATALLQHCASQSEKCKIRDAPEYDRFVKDLSGGFLTVRKDNDEHPYQEEHDGKWRKEEVEKLRKERTYGMTKPAGFW